MKKRDRKNLEFLLNADRDTLRDWYESVDEDDHEYAMELLMQAAGAGLGTAAETRTLH